MFDHNETLDEARQRNVREALFEDIGTNDWTGQLLPAQQIVKAQVIVREAAILCGQQWFSDCLLALDPQAHITWLYSDGQLMQADTAVCCIQAQARALLSAERPALNFLQLLSATATATRHHVNALSQTAERPYDCIILDTRKTIPGLRLAQKYAVRVGGGMNQRLALYHGILIKENHIAAAGSITAALRAAYALNAGVDIQIEVENLTELQEALTAGAKSVLLDNFTLDMMRSAVQLTQGRALLEASGGITLQQLSAIAATGIDRISIGRLTKDIQAIDYSLRVLERL